ncbi:hypothetical protein G6011_04882 [Alternaria panax]|uniref:DUF7730 domain-containing protein n=1 Tax=Alternaria panax TaxID=48097 RepID=A0AAD4IHC2_9PLEO|nr:hypothetical protein G6011_04882 [Alternaria panax]
MSPISHTPSTADPMMKPKKSLLDRLPGIRWAPHDIPSTPPSTEPSSSKPKSRNPFALKSSTSLHGVVRLRKSTLSLTSEPDVEVDARTHAQGQSTFFARLPIELRRMVYEYVMGAEIVHLTLSTKKKRFGHFLCDSDGDSREYMCRVLVFGRKGTRLYSGGVAVARVCRRMYVLLSSSDHHCDIMGKTDRMLGFRYSEAIPYLYSAHTFSLLHITHLLCLPSSIPQPRLDSIRTLHVRWAIRALPYLRRGPSNRLAYREDTANWERAWRIIAGMHGLRHLQVMLIDPSPQQLWEITWVELEDILLDSVRTVKRPRDAVVILPYPSCRTDWDMGDSTVRLRRPGSGVDAGRDEDGNV